MKRIIKKRKTRKIREDALKQLRETKAKLQKDHPDLWAAVKKLVEKTGAAEAAFPDAKTAPVQGNETEVVDKEKTMEIILKYAAKNPDAKSIKDELKKFLN